jgi:hypothetical protein
MAGRQGTGDQARLAIRDHMRAQPATAPQLSEATILKIVTSGIGAVEAAKLLDTTPRWLTELANRGEVACVPTALGRLYDREDVLRLAEARRIAQAGRPRRGRPRKKIHQTGGVIADPAALPV